MQPTVQAALITTIGTSDAIVGSFASALLSANKQKKREIEAELRKQKSVIHDEFVSYLIAQMAHQKMNKGNGIQLWTAMAGSEH